MDTTRSLQTLARMHQTTWRHMAGNSNAESCLRPHQISRSRPELKKLFDNYNYPERFVPHYLNTIFVVRIHVVLNTCLC